jgi:hypothetical protein
VYLVQKSLSVRSLENRAAGNAERVHDRRPPKRKSNRCANWLRNRMASRARPSFIRASQHGSRASDGVPIADLKLTAQRVATISRTP